MPSGIPFSLGRIRTLLPLDSGGRHAPLPGCRPVGNTWMAEAGRIAWSGYFSVMTRPAWFSGGARREISRKLAIIGQPSLQSIRLSSADKPKRG